MKTETNNPTATADMFAAVAGTLIGAIGKSMENMISDARERRHNALRLAILNGEKLTLDEMLSCMQWPSWKTTKEIAIEIGLPYPTVKAARKMWYHKYL